LPIPLDLETKHVLPLLENNHPAASRHPAKAGNFKVNIKHDDFDFDFIPRLGGVPPKGAGWFLSTVVKPISSRMTISQKNGHGTPCPYIKSP
jgi:hypothetical protein